MSDKNGLDFGDYVLIEQKRYGCEIEMYCHKVINHLESNSWVDVPVQSPATESIHGEMAEVIGCITCGVDERDVLRYRVCDVIKGHNSSYNLALDDAKGAVERVECPDIFRYAIRLAIAAIGGLRRKG